MNKNEVEEAVRAGRPLAGEDLRGADLTGADLEGGTGGK